ncbi:MAG: helix-turn-helix domain-containing protein [Candidatus Azotimanducaceae bacterium]|uniref:Helix-turn-helix domain-containing protein n=1 Tax=OM182 bacterium TaxID=2510334 RepID=A0A520S0W7_9GAMM|nr:hypothetical protein [Gammaproteobacteria bacterium]OUV67451.1 MAG: hypothetical protein CBC93_05355 [Gammaproteobacteria bacterium TMED133]RZO76127.1 MAG: helix-turn-helix domain-containing protein [OM182 bacterium]
MEDISAGETVSELLVSAREKLGLSQKDVADMLFLQITFIQSIDEGLFNELPKRAYIKGYLRSYARALDLDPDYIIGLYELESDSEHLSDVRDVMEERVGKVLFTGPLLQAGVFGLSVIFFVFLLVWFSSDDGKEIEFVDDLSNLGEVVQSDPETTEQAQVFETESNQANPLPPVELNDAGSTSQEEGVLNDSMDGKTAESGLSIEDIKGITLERSSKDGKQYILVQAGGEDHLVFAFLGQCWVEVEDAEGYSIYGDLNSENDVLNIYGMAPFNVVLGRAAVVTMSYNGEEIDLSEYTESDQIIEIKLGQT